MSTVKLITPQPVHYGLKVTEEELQELRHAISMAAAHAQSSIERDQKQVNEFGQRVAIGDSEGMNEHNTRMLESWRGHLQRDEKEFERYKAAMSILSRVEVIRPRKRRR